MRRFDEFCQKFFAASRRDFSIKISLADIYSKNTGTARRKERGKRKRRAAKPAPAAIVDRKAGQAAEEKNKGAAQGRVKNCRYRDMNEVSNPQHYNEHPSGVECIEIAEHFGFNIGNAIKYLWRAGLKGDRVTDLKKAVWYVNREIERLTVPTRIMRIK